MPGSYEIFVRTEFSAAHCLRGYPGDCAQLHGHNWVVKVFLRCRQLNQIGLGIDFREVKTAIGEIVQEFDHNNLNEFPAFQEENPSSENIARFLYRQLGRKLNSPGVRVSGVKISESPGQGVCYREEEDCESCL